MSVTMCVFCGNYLEVDSSKSDECTERVRRALAGQRMHLACKMRKIDDLLAAAEFTMNLLNRHADRGEPDAKAASHFLGKAILAMREIEGVDSGPIEGAKL